MKRIRPLLRLSQRSSTANPSLARAVSSVTLIVYGWDVNEPGTLSWVFPSVSSAMSAVRALKNAVRWLIVAGRRAASDSLDIDDVRLHERVLLERRTG